MKKPTIEDLKKELADANKRIEIIARQRDEQFMVRSLIIAAGLLDEDKFIQAEQLLDKDS